MYASAYLFFIWNEEEGEFNCPSKGFVNVESVFFNEFKFTNNFMVHIIYTNL